MFLLWCGDVLPKVCIFVPRLVSGTGRGFGSAPQQKHTRYAPGARPVTVDGRGRRHNVWLRRPVCRQADGELKIKKHLDNKYFPRTGRGRFTTSLLLDTAQRTP